MNENEENIKRKFHKKSNSETKIPNGGGIENLQYLQIINFIEQGKIQNLIHFLENGISSNQILNQVINSLIQKYENGNKNFYELLNILLFFGASVNIPIIYNGLHPIKENDNVTLLMFGIKNNDLNLINLVLNFNIEIEKPDIFGRNAIIYAIIYDHNDSTDILNLLIKYKANINYSLNLEMSKDHFEYQSAFTLAIFKDLINITKCLLDNNVDINFRTKPNGDTVLHLAALYSKARLLELLLSKTEMLDFLEAKNNEGKIPIELVKPDDKEKKEKINIFTKYYNILNNLKINNQNINQSYQALNNNIDNMNPQLNHLQQMNQMIQLNKLKESNINNNNINQIMISNFDSYNNNRINLKIMNNKSKINIPKSSNIRYLPQEMNMNLENNQNNNINSLNKYLFNINNQNNNILQNYINKNDIKENNNIFENENNNINQMSKIYSNNQNTNINIENKKNNNAHNHKDFIQNKMQNNSQDINNLNNFNQNISNSNPFKLSQIKKRLNNKLITKNSLLSYNLEIPIEFIKNKEIKNNKIKDIPSMNNFIRQKTIPIFSLDLCDKTLSLEYKLYELKEKIMIENKKLQESNLDYYKNEYEKHIEELERLNKNITSINNKIENNEEKIKNLLEEKNNLIESIPKDKFLNNRDKLTYEQYLDLKFEPIEFDDKFIIQTLNKDLLDYEKYINYKMNKKKPKIELIFQKLKLIINEINPDYEISISGAFGQGLCLPWSNLEIILVNNNKNNENIFSDNLTEIETTIGEKSIQSNTELNNNLIEEVKNKNEAKLLLRNLLNNLKKNNILSEINEKYNFLYFTINEGDDDKFTIIIRLEKPNNSENKVRDLIKSYLNEYPFLYTLFLALQTILKCASLDNKHSGGLSSYSLILMIVSFIQFKKIDLNNSFDKANIIGKYFYDFLNFYGNDFDYTKYVIIPYTINEINSPLKDRETLINFLPNPTIKELTIFDPLEKKRNAAKSTSMFITIKIAFLIAFMITKENCECGCHYGKAIFEHNYISSEHSYLKRMFNSVKRFIPNE